MQIVSNDLLLGPRLISDTQLLGFMSRRNLGLEVLRSGVKELPMVDTTMMRKFGILTRKGGYLSPATRAAISLLESVGVERSDRLSA